MKRKFIWISMILFILLFSLAAAAVYLNFFYKSEFSEEISVPQIENETTDLSNLTFCELVKNPENYDGKMVRLEAKITFGTEGAWFSDTRCGLDYAAIAHAKNAEVWKAISKAREGKKGELWKSELNLVVIGEFKNKVYNDGCCLTTPFQFEILKVEKASKID